MDIDVGVASIADSLGLTEEQPDPKEPIEGDPPIEGEQPAEKVEPAEGEPAEEAQLRPVPKSWAKETHELWAKIPPEAQAQIELREKQMLDGLEQYKGDSGLGKQMRDIMNPYEPILRSQNIPPTKAVEYLMNAHYKLSTLQGDQKVAYFNTIAQTYGIDLGMKQPEVSPELANLRRELDEIKGRMTQSQRQQYEAVKGQVTNDVNSFADAKDEKGTKLHPYFDEVSGDIIALLNAGEELGTAYEKAVWANPVTRAKEQARALKEHETKLRQQSTEDAKEARRSSSMNVRSRDTKRSPTEVLGKMDDTLKETLRDIQSRTH